jgi:DNA-binding MarR family transcriptional regulator
MSIEDDAQYDIKTKADGTVDFRLSSTHRGFLKLLAQRGGESAYDFSIVTEDVAKHIKLLIQPMGLIKQVHIIGYETRVLLRLTSTGRNILDQILASEKQKLDITRLS